jgi:hypothetical protein
MLTFLAIACKQKFVLDSYEDEAVGHMEKNADGKMAITRVELRPQISLARGSNTQCGRACPPEGRLGSCLTNTRPVSESTASDHRSPLALW